MRAREAPPLPLSPAPVPPDDVSPCADMLCNTYINVLNVTK
jgi:hypothetical protein